MDYSEYLADIEIAEMEMKKMKLFPNNIVAGFYCIPAHNHQAYYALLSKNSNAYEMTYIKPRIYEYVLPCPIKMYSFAECRQADKHPAKQGQFIIGIKKATADYAERLLQALGVLPDKYIKGSEGICSDRVTQGVKLFADNPKEVFYDDASGMLESVPEYIPFFNRLHLEIERFIEA